MMNNEKKKAVILLSGGIDSAVLAYQMKKEGVELHALSLVNNEGRSNKGELGCAVEIANRLDIPHLMLDVSIFAKLFEDVPRMIYAVGGKLGGCVPEECKVAPLSVETMHMLSMMYAISHGIERVLWSIHRDDLTLQYGTQDVLSYLNNMEKISLLGTESYCKIEAPFLLKRKFEIIKLGQELGVPFEKTFSCCSSENHVQCGECEQCLKRIKAFRDAGIEDKITFAKHAYAVDA